MPAPEPGRRPPRGSSLAWWRVPVFGLIGAVLGVELSAAMAMSGNPLANRIASMPGHLYWLLTLGPQRLKAHSIYASRELSAIAMANAAAWALLGLAVGVVLALVRRPRQME